jgi:hypothetical protein
MNRTSVRLSVCLLLICCALPLVAQNSASTESVVPAMVKFTGTLNDADGKPLTGTVGVTFLLYKEQAGRVRQVSRSSRPGTPRSHTRGV